MAPGTLPTGPLNAITDVPGVLVGQTTVIRGDSIRTGVTAILPHGGNLYQDRVPAAVFVINGFGKLVGTTQLAELGELETPILLTCTLCVWKAADAMAAWLLMQPGMGEVRSINPVVGETNDSYLNAIRQRPISADDVVAALSTARTGPVAEGQRRRGHRDHHARVEGRHRHLVASGSHGRQHLDGRRAGADQLRGERRAHPHGRAGRPAARTGRRVRHRARRRGPPDRS